MATTPSRRTRPPWPIPLPTVWVVILCCLDGSILTGVGGLQDCDAAYKTGSDQLFVPFQSECELAAGTYTYSSVQVNGTLHAKTSGSSFVTLNADWMAVGPKGRVLSDGQGESPGAGPGAGSPDGSGGGHGGRGGNPGGSFLTSSQSRAHGSFHSPVTLGSGGGGQASCGGSGGGALKVKVTTWLKVDGVISVQGHDGGQGKCGGGAGGSIKVEAERVEGGGHILANGGRGGSGGSGRGGGGGGGRVTLTYNTEGFLGTALAHGGIGGDVEALIPNLQAATSSGSIRYAILDNTRYPQNYWRPSSNTPSQYLELRVLGDVPYYVTSVETRGAGTANNWYVSSYKLQIYDDETGNWKTMLDSDYKEVIAANTDQSGVVKRYLAYPALTRKIRVFPHDFHINMAMVARLYGYTSQTEAGFMEMHTSPPADGGAGGAGTVFWVKEGSPGVGELRLDNRGQWAGLRVTGTDIDLSATGGATWMLDTTPNLDKIVLQNAAILNIDVTLDVSDIQTDNTSLVYVSASRTLQIGNQFDGNKYVTSSATLQPARDSDVTFEKWSFIMGTLDIRGNVELTVGGNMTLQAQPLNLQRLTVEEESTLTIMGNHTFPLTVTSLTVYGDLHANEMRLYGLQALSTGPRSNVSFDPSTSATHLGNTVDIRGMFYLRKPVSFTNCTRLMIDGGNLTWSGSDTVTIDCVNVTINGFLQPTGDVIFGSDVRDTLVGPLGRLSLTAGGPIQTHTLSVSGVMEVKNKASFQSPIHDKKKITKFIVHGPGGKLLLDTQNLSMITNGSDVTDMNHSELYADEITVNGLFDARRVSFPERVTSLTVGNGGNFTFHPTSELQVDDLKSHGVMTSLVPFSVSGSSLIRARTLLVGENGTVTLDAVAQKDGEYSGVSYLVIDSVTVNGVMKAGKLINHQPPLTHGWNNLAVGPKGRFTFYPNDTFYLGYAGVAGVMESLVPVTIRPPPSFASNSNHFVVDTTGSVKLGIQEASDSHNDVQCGRLEVKPGGKIDAGFQKPTPGSQAVSPLSLFTVATVVVDGTLQGDSVKVVADDVSVGGSVTAAGGGFYSNEGPGAGKTASTGASGASHGGRGGRGGYSSRYTLASNLPYGSIYEANTWGSGGGSTSPSYQNGGRGGGYIVMEVSGRFFVNGTVSVDGLDATATHAGGGSGGSLRVRCQMFTGSGNLSSNGGNGKSRGGGGAGGRVYVDFRSGDFKSGHVSAHGGSGTEPGGPGLIYLHGDDIRNLRVDNDCQKPQVTEHGGSWAGETEYQDYTHTGGIAYLLPQNDSFTYDFTIVELYGGAHLTFNGTGTRVKAIQIVGDDTGHLHVPPAHTLEWTQETDYQRANMTWQLFLYRGAELILPAAPVEIRPPLSDPAPCAVNLNLLRSNELKIWGTVKGKDARLIVGSGETVTWELSAPRDLSLSSVTVQDGGQLHFVSHYGNTSDQWAVTISSTNDKFDSHFTVEGGGSVEADTLHVTTDVMQVDASGWLSVGGRGLLTGQGAGQGNGGAGHGGRGDSGPSSGARGGDIYGSLYQPVDFGSGGGGATNTTGRGGGILILSVRKNLIVEGEIEADGLGGASGGSGGSIWIDTCDLEGSGVISASGGNVTSGTRGAGGGGRVAVHYRHTDWWFGSLRAHGGSSTKGHAGAGTILLKDSTPDVKNRTLIIDNGGRSLGYTTTNHSQYANDAGRTWLIDNSTSQFEDVRILGHAHFALHPDLVEPFGLHSHVISGDNSGVLHVGPGQTLAFRLVDEIEAFTSVFIYEGGTLHLPSFFRCRDVNITVWGTLGIDEVEVSSNCQLKFGRKAHIAGEGYISTEGVLRVPTLTVADGGEVTVPPGLEDEDNSLTLVVDNLNVHGGGTIHAVHLNITVGNLTVDDLGTIVGDLHLIPCVEGQGQDGEGASGAGHGGRGGRGSAQNATGHAYGSVFHPSTRGCRGGATTVNQLAGRGGGVVYLKVTGTLHNDGTVRCNGEAGSGGGGGGSGGSILLEVELIKGYGSFQVTGGDGSKLSDKVGGGGAGGRIAMHFAHNKTFAGDFDAYGGLSDGGHSDGGPGTVFFYHTGYKHTTLVINNIGRGPRGEKNVIEDYTDLEHDAGRAWFLPHHGNTEFTVNNSYHFNELQMYGGAQLAVLTDPPGSPASLLFDNMIGDRTGAIHVGPNQTMDLQRPSLDLPFSVHVYREGFLGLAPETTIHNVDIFLNGTLANVRNLTIHHGGTLWLFRDGRTEHEPASSYRFEVVHVKAGGFLHMITDPVREPGINFRTVWFKIDGGGLARGTNFYVHTTNMSVDASGVLSADGLGYEYNDGGPKDGSWVRQGVNGVINAGQGHSKGRVGSGAGHGGSGGRAGEDGVQIGFPYGDLYEPTLLGSAGGGRGGGAGGGRIWLNVTDTLLLDGRVTAGGLDGSVTDGEVGGGGSGGSVWVHCNTLTGYGALLAKGGRGGNGSATLPGGGGGAGGRIALNFHNNKTFSEFRFLAAGGGGGNSNCSACDKTSTGGSGGPGTAFVYHIVYNHRSLIIDNDGAAKPEEKYITWDDMPQNEGRAWVLPVSSLHRFSAGSYRFEFEEVQIRGNGHLAFMPPLQQEYLQLPTSDVDLFNFNDHLNISTNLTIFFKYMIGDRTGAVHVGDKQTLDLEREEIDLRFSCYVYKGGYLGLAPVTFVHGVEIHLAGVLANIVNVTLHHGGFLWLKHGGRTLGEAESQYRFEVMRIQDEARVNATTDPITEPGITFTLHALIVEGGGILHGTKITMTAVNITVDAGGKIAADGLGYRPEHTNATHGAISLHGDVNPGMPKLAASSGSGAGHGGSGGHGALDLDLGAGFAYGDLFEPDVFGSSGGSGVGGAGGGSGGGMIWMNVTGVIYIDGEVTAHGSEAPPTSGGGGGSGGSIWMYSELLKGYGRISANGGAGSNLSSDPGGGGAGGRVALYFRHNETFSSFKYTAYGGAAGNTTKAQNGGAGTVFIYHLQEDHQTIIIDNNGLQPPTEEHIIDSYNDLSGDSCRTWILPQSGRHFFANGNYSYAFDELQIYGSAHMAVLVEPFPAPTDLFFRYMIGDRTGTVHLGDQQVMDLERPEIDLPFNVQVYAGGYLGLAPVTIVHGVSVWLAGELDHVTNVTLRHGGQLSIKYGGHTTGQPFNSARFNYIRVQDRSNFKAVRDDFAVDTGLVLTADYILIEGGGNLFATNLSLDVNTLSIDDGGSLHADGWGYTPSTPTTSSVNVGAGTSSSRGSSGGGHGGSSGSGAGTNTTGIPYGDIFNPDEIGSAGGGLDAGGNGGGLLYITVKGTMWLDGEIRADGAHATAGFGGGGSGGTVHLIVQHIKGFGNITANGGDQYPGGAGGGGSGGRIAVNFWRNETYRGTFQAHGGYANITATTAEPGGPGPVFLFHEGQGHKTVYVHNNFLHSRTVGKVTDFSDLSQDVFKAWIIEQDTDQKYLDGNNRSTTFDELQIYGNAHLVVHPRDPDAGLVLHFRHMIGDRSGVLHVGPGQVMDLKRDVIDTPFSSYVYPTAYLGLAPDTNIDQVFVQVEGIVDHIHNLTLIAGGQLRLFPTGSTGSEPALTYTINGTTVVKARSSINASAPFAPGFTYDLNFGWLTVEGGGAIRGKDLSIKAIDVTVDDGGVVDVSDGGFLADLGPAPGLPHRLGNSGASHGGTGGRGQCDGYVTCRLPRNHPYGDLYRPTHYGSGGAGTTGGIGGGRLSLTVAHTLTVDGYIQANSRPVKSGDHTLTSGGSAGSIIINTVNITGSHTGAIEAVGGVSDTIKGGGGAGGRVAVYHSTHHAMPPYRGDYHVHGGQPATSSGAEAGASGTVYILDEKTGKSTLRVDNKGHKPVTEQDDLINIGRRLDFSSPAATHSKSKTFTATSGFTVTSTANVYNYDTWYHSCRYAPNSATTYQLHYLFDQTLKADTDQFFLAASGSTTLTLDLKGDYRVNKVKVFPNSLYPTKFNVSGSTFSGEKFEITSNYVVPELPIKQGSYLDLPVDRDLAVLTLDLTSLGSCQTAYASLSEIEIYVGDTSPEQRYKRDELHGASTWVSLDATHRGFEFHSVHVLGGGHVVFEDGAAQNTPFSVDIDTLYSDKTGFLHVGYKQSMNINSTAIDVPFNLVAYEDTHVKYPARTFFTQTKLSSLGKVSGVKDLYVYKGGQVRLGSEARIGEVSEVREVALQSLHVQDGGTFEVDSGHHASDVTIIADTVKIYGGGHLVASYGLTLNVSHHMAVYSGGHLDLSGRGYAPLGPFRSAGFGENSTHGGSGGGHGGSGGRGSGVTKAGQGYDSIVEPNNHGSPGGYGHDFGELTFGGHPHGNQLIRKGLGGSGGGSVKVNAQNLDLDGRINTDGATPHANYGTGAGGGAGGSVWIECSEARGVGAITAGGATGGRSTGGGGGGGRISVQCESLHKFNVTARAGGGNSDSEVGGAGTVYLETRNHSTGETTRRFLRVDNFCLPYPRDVTKRSEPLRNLLEGQYNDLDLVGGVTWLYSREGRYDFDEVRIEGQAQVALLSNTSSDDVRINAGLLSGDRSGLLHIGGRQTFAFSDVNTYIPVNIMAYRSSKVIVPKGHVVMREVFWENNGTVSGVDEFTVENQARLFMWSHGRTVGRQEGTYALTNVSVKAGGRAEFLTADQGPVVALEVTRLTINGKGAVRTNHLRLTAVNVTVDLSGDFEADATGHANGQGPGAGLSQDGHSGGSGGAHGGRGGCSLYGYFSAPGYDSLYTPSDMGSGGGDGQSARGGRGGGVIHMNVSDILRVEGRLHANGESGQGQTGGGGAGGSIWMNVKHLDGEGSIEVTGGRGASSNGGGGGGGRVALYHTGDNHFSGHTLLHGGQASQHYGGSGSLYTENRSNITEVYKKITVDNNGFTSSARIHTTRELSLRHSPVSSTATSLRTFSNVSVVTNGAVWRYNSISRYYPLSSIFDGSLGSVYSYITSRQETNITLTFPYPTLVSHLHVFPLCSSSEAVLYQVHSYSEGTEKSHTADWVDTDGCVPRTDQFGRVDVLSYVDIIVVTLKAKRSRVGLSELEVYLQDDPDTWRQTTYLTATGSAVLTSSDDHHDHTVDEVVIRGGAVLDIEGQDVTLTTTKLTGDNSGHVRVHGNQTLLVTSPKLTMPAGVHSWVNSIVDLPDTWDCRDIDFYLRGAFTSMTSMTVGSGCRWTSQHLSPSTQHLTHLDIKTFGSVSVITPVVAMTTLNGTTLTVRSGAKLLTNDLYLRYTNITVEPQAFLTADKGVPELHLAAAEGRGFSSATGSSGGGHGGSGGQGQGQVNAGRAYGSFLDPSLYGSSGGHSIFPHNGGRGGGKLRLEVADVLTVDGTISASGGHFESPRSGGGSGGSIMIHTRVVDGDGSIQAAGGGGYSGSAHDGGGGAGGRMAMYYIQNYFVGTYVSAGGKGGPQAENGGAGTVYLHKIPPVAADHPYGEYVINRTLFIDGLGRGPRSESADLTPEAYSNTSLGSSTAWILPASYPAFVQGVTGSNPRNISLEELQIYGETNVALTADNAHTDAISLNLHTIQGDRTGHLHIGHNQTLFIGDGRLPLDLDVYHGGQITLQGELRVAGVKARIRGVVKNVDNLTIADGGDLGIYKMLDVNGQRIDEIPFLAINVRNRGQLTVHNDQWQRVLRGHSVQVFPGGRLTTRNVYLDVQRLLVDVMGVFEADGQGFCSGEGQGGGVTGPDGHGTGGSHGGEGGADNYKDSPSKAYGSLIAPRDFGSGGGNSSSGQTGGCGGGIIRLNVSELMKIDGNLSVGGTHGSDLTGGGSGGSLHFTTGHFDGSGVLQATGGNGRNGGSGGRIAGEASLIQFIGSYKTRGGAGSGGGEVGAAGTMLLTDRYHDDRKTLRVYNQEGKGERKTQITIPESPGEDYNLDVLDLGQHAQVGLLATDDQGHPVAGERYLRITTVAGDHTAVVHVEPEMWLNIDFNDTAILSFDVKLYENATVNLPYNTYLHDSRVTLYGGVLQGVHTLNISLDGVFTIYPPARLNTSNSLASKELRLNSISILDGGRFEFTGRAESDDQLDIVLGGGLVIQGGGVMTGNNLNISAINITVDTDGLIETSGRGWGAGQGPSPGQSNDTGGSGGSHGGLGGRGTATSHSAAAYDDTRRPNGAGSGGSLMSTGAKVSGGEGGGVLTLTASHLLDLDGTLDASANHANTAGCGGGAGGSVVVTAAHIAGKGSVEARGGGGSCVPNCGQCDSERRCEGCASGYYRVRQACVTEYCYNHYASCCGADPYCGQMRGGGGGGGRISVTATSSYTYRGHYQTYGGRSQFEVGGSGTTFLSFPTEEGNQTETTLIVDNKGKTPLTEFVNSITEDSARSYLVVSELETFDRVQVLGGAHLVMKKKDGVADDVSVTIGNLMGDNSGMVHSSQEMRVTVADTVDPFPTSLRVYDNSEMDLPSKMTLKRLAYKTVHINGMISGLQDLKIGQGVTMLLGQLGGMRGIGQRQYNISSLDISADGVLSADYVNELQPSLQLTVNTTVRMHAGSKIKAPWVKVKAADIQVDAAAVIDASGTAPASMDQNGVDNPAGGGSGGGSAAAGGQGQYTSLAGPAPDYGSLYLPHEYGGNGGTGGGATVDSRCTPLGKYTGGRGGGVIELDANNVRVDGQLLSEGHQGQGSRSGGGAGGSIQIQTQNFRGDGLLSVRGGSVPTGTTSCRGGGGGGGRVAIYYSSLFYEGKVLAQGGGNGLECGGAGTIIWRDTDEAGFELVVDNKDTCQPLNSTIDFGILSDTHRGEHSFHTWLYDPLTSHLHDFKAVTIAGSAQLALHRRNIDSFTQTMLIHKTNGDKSGWLHLGPHQDLTAELPRDSPELQFSVRSYPGAVMRAGSTLIVHNVTLDIQGVLAGVDNLVIGPHGDVILRPYGDSSSNLTTEVQFGSIHIQGGGQLTVASEEKGMRLTGQQLRVDSGGVLALDKLDLVVGELIVNDSASSQPLGSLLAATRVGENWVEGVVTVVKGE